MLILAYFLIINLKFNYVTLIICIIGATAPGSRLKGSYSRPLGYRNDRSSLSNIGQYIATNNSISSARSNRIPNQNNSFIPSDSNPIG